MWLITGQHLVVVANAAYFCIGFIIIINCNISFVEEISHFAICIYFIYIYISALLREWPIRRLCCLKSMLQWESLQLLGLRQRSQMTDYGTFFKKRRRDCFNWEYFRLQLGVLLGNYVRPTSTNQRTDGHKKVTF